MLMSPLATWEIMKLIVDAVLLCMSSKCGETARILDSRSKRKTQSVLQDISISENYETDFSDDVTIRQVVINSRKS